MLWSELKEAIRNPNRFADDLLDKAVDEAMITIRTGLAVQEELQNAAEGLGYQKVFPLPFPDHPHEIREVFRSFEKIPNGVEIDVDTSYSRRARLYELPNGTATVRHAPHDVELADAVERGYKYYLPGTKPLVIHYRFPGVGSLAFTPINAVAEALGERLRKL